MVEFRKPPSPADQAPHGGLLDGGEGLPLTVILLGVAGLGILAALLWTTGQRRPWHRGSGTRPDALAPEEERDD